jgi:hypothetical protein
MEEVLNLVQALQVAHVFAPYVVLPGSHDAELYRKQRPTGKDN